MLTYNLLTPPSIVAGELAQAVAPNAQIWRQQADITTQQLNAQQVENERLRAEIERLKASQWRDFTATAYTAHQESTGKEPGDKSYGITASGQPVRAYYTIACPPSIPFGTRLEIESVGVRVCTDRGGRITEGHLDIYISNLKEAQAFGRKTVKVRKIGEESE
jgi:3D (Asp-Asp-Asp) domain-containing protein